MLCETIRSLTPGPRWGLAAALAFAPGPTPLAAAPAAPEAGPEQTPDKSRYSLWHPTPAALLRELSADRPDKTESAYTVDAGHFQVEMDLASSTMDRDRSGGGDTRTEAWSVAPMNLKVGLLNDVDLQLVLEPWSTVRTEDRVAGTTRHQSGFGDLTLRVKKNLWGNDRGRTALAMMPFVKLPTSQDGLGNDAVEGGLIFPFALALARGWSLGTTTVVSGMQNEASSGYHAAFVNSVTLGYDFTRRLSGYAEFYAELSTERAAPWVGTVDFGLTYGLTADLQLDGGVNVGVTEAADDLNLFVGLTWRF